MNTMPKLIAGLLVEIFDGKADDMLDKITDAVRARKIALGQDRAANIKRGDTVRFLKPIRPTYIRGLTAPVTKVNDKSVVVDVPADSKYGRFAGARGVRVPMTCVERVVA